MKPWVNFREVKKSVTMQQALARYAIQLKAAGPAVVRGRCPLPVHTSDSGNSFSVDTQRNIWACHSESCIAAREGRIGGNVLDFVASMERCSIREAALLLQYPVVKKHSLVPAKQPVRLSVGITHNPPLAFRLAKLVKQHAYLMGRGVDVALASQFGIGYFRGPGFLAGRIAIPIHNAGGQVVAYAGRAVDEAGPKYLFPPAFQKLVELFNLHRARANASEELIVVEGFFDCMRVHQAGFQNVVALMGCTISTQQIAHLASDCARVVLLLDSDSAGRRAMPMISGKLEAHGLAVKTTYLPDGRQPDNMLIQDLRVLLRARP